MPDETWTVARGDELLELFHAQDLDSELPASSAIYLWKWSLRSPYGPRIDSPDTVLDWIDLLLQTPQGSVDRSRLNHSLFLNRIEIVGTGLTSNQRGALKAFLASQKNWRWLRAYFERLAPHIPALYVGETGHLPTRIRSHISGETDFGIKVTDDSRLQWENLDLHYLPIGPPSENPSERRKALEYITAVMTVAGYTRRPG